MHQGANRWQHETDERVVCRHQGKVAKKGIDVKSGDQNMTDKRRHTRKRKDETNPRKQNPKGKKLKKERQDNEKEKQTKRTQPQRCQAPKPSTSRRRYTEKQLNSPTGDERKEKEYENKQKKGR